LKEGEEEEEESQKESEKVDENFIKLQEDMQKNLPIKRLAHCWSITALDNDYNVMLSPESLFENHCILYKKEDVNYYYKIYKNKTILEAALEDNKKMFKRKGDNRKVYIDFSKFAKLRQKKILNYSLFRDQEVAYNEGSSNLNSRFIDFENLFTTQDMTVILKMMKGLDAYMCYSILPEGEVDYKQFVHNTVHIIPRESFLKVTNLENLGIDLCNILTMERMFINDLGIVSDLNVRLHNEEMERR